MDAMINSNLAFRIGTEAFGLNVKHIQAIMEYSHITKMPNTPNFMLGVMNLRGSVVPVIDTRIILGTSISEITSNSCILIIEYNQNGIDKTLGYLVDVVSEAIEIDESGIKATPYFCSNSKEAVISGMIARDEKLLNHYCMMSDTNLSSNN